MSEQSQIIPFGPKPDDKPAQPGAKKKPERVFKDGPWAQKLMYGSDIKLAVEATERLKLRMTEWLGEAIRLRVAQEHGMVEYKPVAIDQTAGQTRGQTVAPAPAALLTLAEVDAIDRAISVAERIAALQNKPLPPRGQVLVAARRRLLRLLA